MDHFPAPPGASHAHRGPTVIILESCLLSICIVVVGFRTWTRAFQRRNFGLDDLFILLALLFLIGQGTAVLLDYSRFGLGRHTWDQTFPMLDTTKLLVTLFENFFVISVGMTRISVLLFHRRLLPSDALSKRYRIINYVAIVTVVGYIIFTTVCQWALCTPAIAIWKSLDPTWAKTHKWHCINEAPWVIGATIVGMLQDFLACSLPLVLFWRIRITMGQRIALTAMFAIGYSICLISLIRVIYTVRGIKTKTTDPTWDNQPVIILAIVESHFSILCASLPALNQYRKHTPFISQVGSRIRLLTKGKSSMASGSQTDSEFANNYAKKDPKDDMKIHLSVQVHSEEHRVEAGEELEETRRTPDNLGRTWLDSEPYDAMKKN